MTPLSAYHLHTKMPFASPLLNLNLRWHLLDQTCIAYSVKKVQINACFHHVTEIGQILETQEMGLKRVKIQIISLGSMAPPPLEAGAFSTHRHSLGIGHHNLY